jgi:hypothetical protein
MEKEQIIKALECCTSEKHECDKCSYCRDEYFCDREQFKKDALTLIKELTEENEVLAAELSRYTENCKQMAEQTKADTVREMQERLNEKIFTIPTVYNSHFGRIVDQIAKEMLEGERDTDGKSD